MSKLIIVFLLVTASLAVESVSKTAIDLMNEGRFQEARSILDSTPASSRYRDLLTALTEKDALKACGMYLEIADKYPDSDCDSVAQERLNLAIEMGIDVAAVREEILMSRSPEKVAPVENKPILTQMEPERATETAATAKQDDAPAADAIPVNETASAETSSGMTIDYTVEEKKEANAEEIVQAAAVPEKIVTEPAKKSVAVETKRENIAAAVPMVTPKTEPAVTTEQPVKIENEPLAYVETKAEKPVVPVEKAPVEMKSSDDAADDLETDATSMGEWYVQVGAFGNHENALRLAAKIRSDGYRVILVPRDMNGAELMQVRVGGYFTIEESRAVAKKLKSDFSVPVAVVNK